MQSEYIGGIVCKMEISMYDTYVSIDLETTGLNPKKIGRASCRERV